MSVKCDRLRPGDEVCDVCPLRALRPVCHDSAKRELQPVAKSSFASRFGVFLISCIALALVPVVFRDIITLHEEPALGQDARSGIAALSVGAGLVMVLASLYGLYFALFGKDKQPPRA